MKVCNDRKDYDEMKNRLEAYIQIWHSKNKDVLKAIVEPNVLFYTKTSTMSDGEQCSLYGIYDFLDDFLQFDQLQTSIHNFICRFHHQKGCCYAEIVCWGVKDDKASQFTIPLLILWKHSTGWKMTHIRQDLIMDNSLYPYIPIIRGEGDSPWLNIIDFDYSILTTNEMIKETVIKYLFGIEHLHFSHCYEVISADYGVYSFFKNHPLMMDYGEKKKAFISQLKQQRLNMNSYICPIIFDKIEIDNERAYVDMQQVSGAILSVENNAFVSSLQQGSTSQLHKTICHQDLIKGPYAIAKGNIELVKENNEWKICYYQLFEGIYRLKRCSDSLYADNC